MSCFKVRAIIMILIELLVFPTYDAVSVKSIVKSVSRFYKRVGQFVGLKETCTSRYLRTDKKGLELEMEKKLYGQPIAISEIPQILSNHWQDISKSEHLMLCFYGSPGTGKTFTTKILKDYIFTQGDRSYFYLFYTGSEAYFGKEGLKQLKDEMEESIKDALNECPYSLIVFDEVEKYPDGFIDSLMDPFIKGLNGYYGKGTFIFMTNKGSDVLMKNAFRLDSSYIWDHDLGAYEGVKYLLTGLSSVFSNEIRIFDFEAKKAALVARVKGTSPTDLEAAMDCNAVRMKEGSFYSSDLVQRGHVKHFIPFLPLKKESVVKCIRAILPSTVDHLEFSIIMTVLDKLPTMSPSYPIYYLSGCKHLESAVYPTLIKLKIKSDEL